MAGVRKELQIVISAKDEASKVIKGFNKELEELTHTVESSVPSLEEWSASLKQIGVVALAGVAAFGAFAVKAAFSAARIDELTFALKAIAKANSISNKTVGETVTELRDFNIAHDKALEITALFIQSQLDLADATKLANVAKDLAVIASQDSSTATRTLTEAISSQSVLTLRQFGIVTTLSQVYEKFAETTGIAADSLTAAEKKQAFLNVVLEEGQKVAGTYDAAMGSVSKQFRSLTGRIIPDFIAVVGKAFEPALTVAIDAVTQGIKDFTFWIENNRDRIEVWGEQLGRIVKIAIEAVKSLTEFLINNKEIILGVFVALGLGLAVLGATFIAAHATVILVFASIAFIVARFAKLWNQNFLGIQTTVRVTFEFLKNVALPAIRNFFSLIRDLVGMFFKNWVEKFNQSRDAVMNVVDAIERLVNKAREIGSSVRFFGRVLGFQHGGFVPGSPGQTVPAMLHGGERVIPRTGTDVNLPRGGGITINLTIEGDVSSIETVDAIVDGIRDVLGRDNELAVKGLAI